MADIPFGLQAYKRSNAFLPEIEALNMYVEKDVTGVTDYVRIQRPGMTMLRNLGSQVRGVFQQDGVLSGRLFAASGVSLYDVGTGAVVGPIASGPGPVEFAATFFGLYMLASGNMYYTNGSSVVTIAAPDGRPFMSADTINNYVVCYCPDGRFYWIEPGATTIDPLNFATAESSPDGGVAVRRLVDEIWFFGASTVEPWQATGDADAPFQRASGRVYDRGCAGRDTVRRFDNGIIWEGDDGIIYRTSNVPQAISTNGIEERIAKAQGERRAFTFDTNGHKFYCLKIPGEGDFAYDAREGEWIRLASPGRYDFKPWVGFGRICASFDSGEVWQMGDTVPGDDGIAFTKRMSGVVPLKGKPQRNPSLSVDMGMSADCVMQLRWRDSDEDFPSFYEDFDLRAPVDNLSMRRMGQVRSPFRVFELSNSELVSISIWGASFGDAWD